MTCWPMARWWGRIVKAAASPVDKPWMWTLLFGYHEDHTPTHGYEPTRGRDGGIREELAPGIALHADDQACGIPNWKRAGVTRRSHVFLSSQCPVTNRMRLTRNVPKAPAAAKPAMTLAQKACRPLSEKCLTSTGLPSQ
jgi:hypothetical protein